MVEDRGAAQRKALGAFIRSQRETLSPEEGGLPAGARRRTPGLRREEVAQLAGFSTTWYSWIEQGRDVAASPFALARLATALRLARAERAYLFELAGRRDPEHGADLTGQVPEAVRTCVDAINAPAYVLDRFWTARAWNAKAGRLFTGWLDRPGDRSLLRFIFLEPSARSLIVDWEQRARRVVAEFRAYCGAHLEDPELRGLVEELRDASPPFAEFWNSQGVLGREGGERRFNHPRDGLLRLEQVTFELAGDPGIKLTVLLPASEDDPPA